MNIDFVGQIKYIIKGRNSLTHVSVLQAISFKYWIGSVVIG